MDDATHAYIDENRKLTARITELTRANADLHSRLDELRRVVACSSHPLMTVPAAPTYPRAAVTDMAAPRPLRGQTASDRLAEHARSELDKFSDPAGGG